MPDTLDASGLLLKTRTEILTELSDGLKTIYGSDINLESNSPDGQHINIIAQQGIDIREVLQKIYTSFDPDQAEGTVLDQRCAFNGVIRKNGTFTFQDVLITVDRAVTLQGLDTQASSLTPTNKPFTVKDNSGTQFYLLNTKVFSGAGNDSLVFRAAELGEVLTNPNTITTQVTVTLGVTAVNNPSAANSIGVDEETDFQLRTRRRASVSLPSIGYLDSIETALNDLETVTSAYVYENDTNITDIYGIPPHSIWVIVEGGSPETIADVIYKKKSTGSNMKGTQSYDITRPNGQLVTFWWDEPISQNIYVKFNISLAVGTIDQAAIKQAIVDNVRWNIGSSANVSDIVVAVKNVNPNFLLTDVLISDDNITYTETVATTSLQHRFVNNTSRITITEV